MPSVDSFMLRALARCGERLKRVLRSVGGASATAPACLCTCGVPTLATVASPPSERRAERCTRMQPPSPWVLHPPNDHLPSSPLTPDL